MKANSIVFLSAIILFGCGLMRVSAQTCAPAPIGLVSAYAGDGNALDARSQNHGTIQNGVTYTAGEVGQAFNLAGNNGDRVLLGNPANLQLQELTIEAWVKRSSTSVVTNSGGVGLFFAYGLNGYAFYIKGDNKLTFGKVGVSEVSQTVAITDTNWHHVAVTVSRANQGRTILYLDGAADFSLNYAPQFDFTTNAAIGSRGDAQTSDVFFGAIDELAIYNRPLAASEIQAIFNAGTAGKCKPLATAAPNDQIFWLAGDGETRDSSGSGNDATPASGMSAPTYSIGKVGQSLTLNGGLFNSLQFASIPDSAALRPQSLTVEGWGRLTSVDSAAPTFFGKALGTGNADSYVVWYQSGTLHGAVCNNGGCLQLNAPSFSLNVWHHIALSYDDPGGAATKTLVLYVDGVAVASGTGGAIAYDTHPALIGADFDFESIRFGWTGGIDELALYSRALSAAEIQSINNAGISGKIKQAATAAGANSQTQVGDATMTFSNVSAAGTTTDYTIDPATAGTLPMGYTNTGLAYDISTTAVYSGLITECFHIPAINDADVFSKLKVLHSENGTLVDKTLSTDFPTRVVCGQTASLSPFVIANGLAPSAASVAVSGRVKAGQKGLARARVTLTDMNGKARSVLTNSFGSFNINNVPAGETYIFSVNHKSYIFAPQVVNITEDLFKLNFTAYTNR